MAVSEATKKIEKERDELANSVQLKEKEKETYHAGIRPGGDVEYIEIRGARVHNLKNVDLNIPLRKLVCFAGPSGSGKTSLAFHTILTESKRRFVNSFPNSMKFFTERPAAVDVDSIFPVLPVFGLPQINPVLGARTVVADVMRLTDSLQNLWFSFSRLFCPTGLSCAHSPCSGPSTPISIHLRLVPKPGSRS